MVSKGCRLSPETRAPGAVEDACAVLRDLIARAAHHGIAPGRIALCGDSAGGAICIGAAALAARSGLALRHLALFYPAIDPACDTASQNALADGPVLTRAAMRWFWDQHLGPDPATGGLLPLDVADPSILPPTTVTVAAYDPLRDEGAAFADRLSQAGVDTILSVAPGLVHGFLSLPVSALAIDAALSETARRLRHGLS